MFEFVVLPMLIAEITKVGFNDLPVEMASNIFRYLDSESLLRAARTCHRWLRIICGDPVLAKRLYRQIKKEERQRREALLNPGLWTQVVRKGSPELLSTNFTKKVRFDRSVSSSLHRKPEESRFNDMVFGVLKSGTRGTKRNRKTQPNYKSGSQKRIRC